MLVARNKSGALQSLIGEHSLVELRQLRTLAPFFCPACEEEVILKIGQTRRAHFSHQRSKRCSYEIEPETDYHRQGKEDLYLWLTRQKKETVLEHYLPKIKQRPDLFIRAPHRQAIEFQCSTIPTDKLKQRILGYKKLAIPSLWILGSNRLKRHSHNIFQINDMDWSALYPLLSSSYALLYYCPITKNVIKLTRIIPLTKTKISAQIQVIPLISFTYTDIYSESSQGPSIDISSWLEQKRKWRMTAFFDKSKDHTYVKQMFLKYRLSLSQYPPFVGIPLKHNVFIRTPSFLWQSWLFIRYILNKPLHSHVVIETIHHDLLQLFQRGIFLKNDLSFSKLKGVTPALESYCLFLCRLNILAKEKTHFIVINGHYKGEGIDQLLVEDCQILKILIN